MTFELLAGSASLHGNRWADQIDRLASGHLFAVPERPGEAPLYQLAGRMASRDVSKRLQTADAVLTALDGGPRGVEALKPWRPPRWMYVVGPVVLSLIVVVLFVATPYPTRQAAPPLLPGSATRVVPAEPPVDPAEGRDREADRGCVSEHESGAIELFSGLTRYTARTYIPAGVASKPPVVVLFHEGTQSAEEMMAEAHTLRPLADKHGFVIVAPQGRTVPERTYPWDDDRAVAMIEGIADELCVDPKAVFVVGHGNGWMAVEDVVCAGLATAAAITSSRIDDRQADCEPVPFLDISPTEIRAKPVSGKGPRPCVKHDLPSLARQEELLRERNRCVGKPTAEQADGHRRLTYACESPLVRWEVQGGQHWPDYESTSRYPECHGTPADFDYAGVIWAFFAEYLPR